MTTVVPLQKALAFLRGDVVSIRISDSTFQTRFLIDEVRFLGEAISNHIQCDLGILAYIVYRISVLRFMQKKHE